MTARAAILARIRQRLGAPRAEAGAIRAEADALIPELGAVRPTFEGVPPLDRFIAKVTSDNLAATLDRLDDAEELPAAVARYLDSHDLGGELCLGTHQIWQLLDWRGIRLHHAVRPNEPAALTRADAAVAETGTLVFSSSPEQPALLNFLPLHHLVVLEAGRIHPYMEDFWATPSGSGADPPRALHFVTGVSGTADIEGQHVNGAHGPRFLHILLIAG